MAQDYHDLIVWQKAIDLSVGVYDLTKEFPKSDLYGLTSQMRRASISVASNIAEGRGRLNTAEFRQFLRLAQGWLFELQTQILSGFGSGDSLKRADLLSEEVSKMLRTFIERLTVRPRTGRSHQTPFAAARS